MPMALRPALPPPLWKRPLATYSGMLSATCNPDILTAEPAPICGSCI